MAFNRALAAHRRDELDLSNKEVAGRAGISEGYLRNIISGSNVPGRRTRHNLERALRLPEDALLVDSDPDEIDDPDEHVSPQPLPPARPPNEPRRPPNKPPGIAERGAA